MPKLIHAVPKYRLHRGSGQAVVTIDSTDRYLGKFGSQSSHQEYDRLISEWLARRRQSLPDAPDSLTINELAVRYWQFAQDYYRKDGRSTGVAPGIRISAQPSCAHVGNVNRSKHRTVQFIRKRIEPEFIEARHQAGSYTVQQPSSPRYAESVS